MKTQTIRADEVRVGDVIQHDLDQMRIDSIFPTAAGLGFLATSKNFPTNTIGVKAFLSKETHEPVTIKAREES